jgi:hypothetical protein
MRFEVYGSLADLSSYFFKPLCRLELFWLCLAATFGVFYGSLCAQVYASVYFAEARLTHKARAARAHVADSQAHTEPWIHVESRAFSACARCAYGYDGIGFRRAYTWL